MPRTRSSKKPGCFNQVKPTLMFTDSPAERLPRRLCSPVNVADNPITAQVLYIDDGLETTWVSPQFHPSMLEMEEAPRRRRKGKQDGDNTGKSAMANQHTSRKRRPVRKSSVTTPIQGERRFPKGFQPLQFLGNSSRNGRAGGEWKRTVEAEDDIEDVRIDDGDDDSIRLEDGKAFRKGHRRKSASTKNVLQRHLNEEWMETGVNDYSGYHGNRSLHRLQNQSRVKPGRSSVTRSRTSSVSGHHGSSHHRYMDDDVGEGSFHHRRLTALREKPVTSNINQRHHDHICNHPQDLPDKYDENFSELDNLHNFCPLGNESYGQSPKFIQSKRKDRGDSARKKLEKFAADTHQFKDTSLHQKEQYLLTDLNQTARDVLQSRGKVLAADTPVSDYGLRVSLRRRRHLLPKHYSDRLLLDS